ncbi:hypothetical protein DXA36_06885 [Eisenbergiella sp. OF01-20]|nr:hypothetical protein DXA36_06885 [Eisenbergiella sp. OF01-20]
MERCLFSFCYKESGKYSSTAAICLSGYPEEDKICYQIIEKKEAGRTITGLRLSIRRLSLQLPSVRSSPAVSA